MRPTPPDRKSGALRTLAACMLTLVCLYPVLPAASAGAPSSASAAYTLQDLEQQLQSTPRLRGRFLQEKHLRDLPRPLVSEGRYVLALGDGLLWHLQRPVAQMLRITASGIAQRGADGRWSQAGGPASRRQDTRLFLAVLSGDTTALQENFDLALAGNAAGWTLTLTPRGNLLQQIFRNIVIRGAATVEQISLHETQGDRSELILLDTEAIDALSAEEQRAYAD